MLAAQLLRTKAAKPATYTAPGGGAAVPVRAVVNDAPGETRREAGEDFYSEAGLAMLDVEVGAEPGGLLTVGNATYRLGTVRASRIPGLVDADLIRTSGEAAEIYDLSLAVVGPGSERVVLDGRTIRASVSRRSDTLEPDEDGGEMVVQRNRVAIRNADLGNARAGSVLRLDGEDLLVSSVRRTAAGVVVLIC